MNYNVSNKRDLVKLLTFWLAPMGFIRIKEDWYLNNNECVSIIGLSKSLYGGQFSLSVAFILKELATDLLPYPPFHMCNFKKHSQFIVPDRDELKKSLDLEYKMLEINRINIIETAIKDFIAPFIIPINSKQIIAHKFRSDVNFEPYCDLDLKLVLERDGYLTRSELKIDN